MKVKINKPAVVSILSGVIEVTDLEFERLKILGLIDEEKETREIPEAKIEKTTRKK